MELNDYQYSHINTNTSTTVKNEAGFLGSVTINTKGVTGNTATLYDGTAATGTVIGVIDTTANVGQLIYNIRLAKGLTVVMATGTAADLTVTWK